jgi:mycoredoxin
MTSASPDQIVMYARERFCPDVARARRRLTELGIEWLEYDTESDEDARQRMIAISGRPNVPTLLIGDRVLVEPSEQQIDDALTAAGFDVAALAGAADD